MCSNFATSCKGAYSYCRNNCNEYGRGLSCYKDCDQASNRCQETGTWRTTNCLKTGMAR